MMPSNILPTILATIQDLSLDTIAPLRKEALQVLISKIKDSLERHGTVQLNFICTHNSRRSHLAQIWAHVAADYYRIGGIQMYSGGTEATAMYPMIGSTLISQGFNINKVSTGANPVYAIQYCNDQYPIIAFSKCYDHDYNPTAQFIAVMTCDHADTHCPTVTGADHKLVIAYDDPKAFDDSPLQAQKYLERSNQIASEMVFVFKTLSKQL